MLTAIHVDDDPRSLDLMRTAAAGVEGLRLEASFTTPAEALAWLEDHQPDLLFLDIEMPSTNGIELAKVLAAHDTDGADVIFVTAHTGFAINAFEACALDYLVKPIYTEKLQESLARYRMRRSRAARPDVQPAGSSAPASLKDQVEELMQNYIREESYPRRIFVSLIGEIRVILLDDVVYFGASGAYTRIFLKNGEVVVCSESIKTYSDSLQRHPHFVRIHRSYLVNKQCIAAVRRKVGDTSVRMSNGDVLAIAQQRRNEIFEQLLK